jgi:glutamine amidotransferase
VSTVAIVDYGLGNVQAIANIYNRLDIPAVLARGPQDLQAASHIVLPGVGAFDWAMDRLETSGMRPTLERLVREEQRPVLGICVGMQMMARRSDEGQAAGLGWIDAEVKLFDEARFVERTHLPHMGWNDVVARPGEALLAGMQDAPRFYFLHSYYFAPHQRDDVIGETDYGGGLFASAVRHGNVMGVQFHPEKSHHWGIQLLKNFAETA